MSAPESALRGPSGFWSALRGPSGFWSALRGPSGFWSALRGPWQVAGQITQLAGVPVTFIDRRSDV